MRMWMVPPAVLCRRHLLGEHGEIHKHRHNFVKMHKMTGRLFPVAQIEPMAMQKRHDELAAEMAQRGYCHASPYVMPDLSYLDEKEKGVHVDVPFSLRELTNRCADCAARLKERVSDV